MFSRPRPVPIPRQRKTPKGDASDVRNAQTLHKHVVGNKEQGVTDYSMSVLENG